MDSSSPSTNPTPAASQSQSSKNGKKRKPPSQLALLHKRIRQYLITCPVALSILRDLGLRSRSTLNSGQFLAWAVDPTEPIFQTIHQYISSGQPRKDLAPFHTLAFSIKALGILRITPGGIPPQFNDDPKNKGVPRKMLWKGIRAIDARNALKRGVKLNKDKFVKYWGSGYCFSDILCDALLMCYDYRYFMEGEQLTDVWRPGNVAYLFLCEILTKNDMYLTYHMEPRAPDQVTPRQSWWARLTKQQPQNPMTVEGIKCEGKWTPDPRGNQEIEGCVWPLGKRIRNWSWTFAEFWGKRTDAFWGNHYTVYDDQRVIPRYLVKVEITEK